MTLIKYNEIMENAVVDPAMKSRIMSAVSASIREQALASATAEKAMDTAADMAAYKTAEMSADKTADKAADKAASKVEVKAATGNEDKVKSQDSKAEVTELPSRRKAKKAPVVIITSIAAGLLVVAGVLFFGTTYLRKAKAASDSVSAHNAEVDYNNQAINEVLDGGGGGKKHEEAQAYSTTVGNAAAETEAAEETYSDDEKYPYAAETGNSEGMGDTRLDRITNALPFDLKGHGTGTYYDSIDEEVFFGVDGERMIILSSDDMTRLTSNLLSDQKDAGTDITTPGGTVIRLYRVVFGNVRALDKGETSTDVNAALFVKDGKAYLIIFSDPQSNEAIGKVADAI